MRAWLISVAILVVLACRGEATSCIPRTTFPSLVSAALSKPGFEHVKAGILFQRNNSGKWQDFYARSETDFFVPASNNKIPTTAAAFLKLGPNWTTSTNFAVTSTSPTVLSNLCVTGSGDPTITSLQLQQFLSQQLGSKGFKTVAHIRVDPELFANTFPDQWEIGDFPWGYGAQSSALTINQNGFNVILTPASSIGGTATIAFEDPMVAPCVSLTSDVVTTFADSPSNPDITWPWVCSSSNGECGIKVIGSIAVNSKPITFSLAVQDPAVNFGCLLRRSIQALGIDVPLAPEVGPCSPSSTFTFNLTSPSLAHIMDECLQDSNNLFAEFFARSLGAGEAPNALDAGLENIRTILGGYNIDVDSLSQQDGSGMSRRNYVTPRVMTQIFQLMSFAPNGALYKSFLPVAGVSGTLAGRFLNTPATGHVFAKTGTLTGVTSLSGYIDSQEGWIFSILINNSINGSTAVRALIDYLVVSIFNLCPN